MSPNQRSFRAHVTGAASHQMCPALPHERGAVAVPLLRIEPGPAAPP
ncbi:hypothetical protein BU14_1546s0003 [Porphyra umbilicalis]|uniref:Uncharacterized protein n=1 Tax=Porphyra umbilicalis TaxID=2786 RepID=A0A1X6NLE8_PORUM|nr:hypothetical protein BU14_1546s0003 [Porphyra umbilicalis]|eukprot:OSX69407.1 hypothetical protein BU14_1546s0003 [Porphyra umbilicalis]